MCKILNAKTGYSRLHNYSWILINNNDNNNKKKKDKKLFYRLAEYMIIIINRDKEIYIFCFHFTFELSTLFIYSLVDSSIISQSIR